MKKTLTILTASIVLSLTNANAGRECSENETYIYWESYSYKTGFANGYDGMYRNNYKRIEDRITYDIGFTDGCEAYKMERDKWLSSGSEKSVD